MVSGINSDNNNIGQSVFQPKTFSKEQISTKDTPDSFNSFADEDEAIISAEAKLQNELEKFNSGGDNLVDLMGTCVTAKTTVAAEVNVINAKKNMFDTILGLAD